MLVFNSVTIGSDEILVFFLCDLVQMVTDQSSAAMLRDPAATLVTTKDSFARVVAQKWCSAEECAMVQLRWCFEASH